LYFIGIILIFQFYGSSGLNNVFKFLSIVLKIILAVAIVLFGDLRLRNHWL
jgi:hypothetical protein